MRNVYLRTTLTALLISLPMAGALADNAEGPDQADQILNPVFHMQTDNTYTNSIGMGPVAGLYMGRSAPAETLSTRLNDELQSSERSLQIAVRDDSINRTGQARIRAEILSIRQEAARDERANAGRLSEAAYRGLFHKVQMVNNDIEALVLGG